MHSGTGGFINDLTTSMQYYVDFMMSAIYNIFKFMFCEYNLNGEITGLNLLGSIVLIILAIIIGISLLNKLMEMVTPWHHDDKFIEDEKEIIHDPTIITEQEDCKLTHQIYLKERKDKIYSEIKKIRLKEHWKNNTNKK